MNKYTQLMAVLMILFGFSACTSEVTLDASSDEAFSDSLIEMAAQMEPEKQEWFKMEVLSLMMSLRKDFQEERNLSRKDADEAAAKFMAGKSAKNILAMNQERKLKSKVNATLRNLMTMMEAEYADNGRYASDITKLHGYSRMKSEMIISLKTSPDGQKFTVTVQSKLNKDFIATGDNL